MAMTQEQKREFREEFHRRMLERKAKKQLEQQQKDGLPKKKRGRPPKIKQAEQAESSETDLSRDLQSALIWKYMEQAMKPLSSSYRLRLMKGLSKGLALAVVDDSQISPAVLVKLFEVSR